MKTSPRSAAIGVLVLSLAGCTAIVDPKGIEERTAFALGREVGSFTISERTEGSGGRIDYRVKTQDGHGYRCYMYSATGLQRAMSFGQTPHSDAVCSALEGAPPPRGQRTLR